MVNFPEIEMVQQNLNLIFHPRWIKLLSLHFQCYGDDIIPVKVPREYTMKLKSKNWGEMLLLLWDLDVYHIQPISDFPGGIDIPQQSTPMTDSSFSKTLMAGFHL